MIKISAILINLSALIIVFLCSSANAQNCPNATPLGYCVIGVPSVQSARAGNWSAYQYIQTLGYYASGDDGGNTIYQATTPDAAFTGAISATTLTISAPTGTVSIGQTVSGSGVTPGTVITGGSGFSWTVSQSQTVPSESMKSSIDNGGSVIVDSVGTRFAATAPSKLNVKQWGAVGSAFTTTATIISANQITVPSSPHQDFVSNESIFVAGAGAQPTLTHPTSIAVSTTGSGSQNYYYTVAAVDAQGGVSTVATISVVKTNGVLHTPLDTIPGSSPPQKYGTAAFNTVNWSAPTTGTPTSYAIYEYDSATVGTPAPSSMTCIAVAEARAAAGDPDAGFSGTISGTTLTISMVAGGVAVGQTVSGAGVAPGTVITGGSGLTWTVSPSQTVTAAEHMQSCCTLSFQDYGSTHYQTCPSYIPQTAQTTKQADLLRTSVLSIAGNTLTLKDNVVTTPLTGQVVGHDDTGPLQSALASALPVNFTCGTYNIVLDLTVSSPAIIDGKACATVKGWGGFDSLSYQGQSSDAVLQNLNFDGSQKSAGFELTAGTAGAVNHFHWSNMEMTSPYNMVKVTHSTNPQMQNIRSDSIRGDYGVYMTGVIGPSVVNFPILYNVDIGKSTTAHSFLADGDVWSITATDLTTFPSPFGVVFRNLVAAGVPTGAGGTYSTGPNLGKFEHLAVNNAWGVAISMEAGESFYEFSRLFLQCAQGNGQPGINIGANAGPVSIGAGSSIFGCDKDGIEDHAGGGLQVDGGTMVYANSQASPGMYDKIHAYCGAAKLSVRLPPGDQFSNRSPQGTPSEKCGVEVDLDFAATCPGVTPVTAPYFGYPQADLDTVPPGLLAPVCDNTGIPGLVRVNQSLVPNISYVSNSAGHTLTATEMVPVFGQQMLYYRSGGVFGTPVTDTTPSATALSSAVSSSPAVGQQFVFTVINLGGSTFTLAGGSGVTISGTAGTVQLRTHPYTCTITTLSPAAVICSG